MANKSKARGTACESDLVAYLRTAGWPTAERRALNGRHDLGDVTGCPGLVWECKAHTRPPHDALVGDWVVDTEVERSNADADFGILVMKRPGHGAAKVASWWAVLPAYDVAALVAFAEGQPRPGLVPLGIRAGFMHGQAAPARMLLADVVALLRGAGYGGPEVAG